MGPWVSDVATTKASELGEEETGWGPGGQELFSVSCLSAFWVSAWRWQVTS